MHLAMKIQPLGLQKVQVSIRQEPVNFKSRFRKLFERQFTGVSEVSAQSGKTAGDHLSCDRNGLEEFESGSLFLDNMVKNFIEETVDKQPKGVQSRFNCFNGNGSYSSDEEFKPLSFSGESNVQSNPDACEFLKSLIPCACVLERNLLADTARIIENNKIHKRKDYLSKQIVINGLLALGYDASICKSRWEKSQSFPAGEYEYMDVIIEGKRVIIDIDFRSEFEIARSTKAYKSILQILPIIFVGKTDRLEKIVTIVSEAARQSMKKKGMHFPPWRRTEYVKSKWLSLHSRISDLSMIPIRCKIDTRKKWGVENSVEEKKSIGELKHWEPPVVVAKSRSLRSGYIVCSGIAFAMKA